VLSKTPLLKVSLWLTCIPLSLIVQHRQLKQICWFCDVIRTKY
jgi:hypothetical protein